MDRSIEILEDRIAPANVLTFTYDPGTGVLDFTAADGDAHFIRIYKTGTDSYRVDGFDDTKIGLLGAFSQDLKGKLTKVSFTGGAGVDHVQLSNLKTLTEVNFIGGAGVDQFEANDIAVSGAVHLQLGVDGGGASFNGVATTIGGDFTVDYGDGGEVNFFSSTNTIKGAAILTGGPNADRFGLQGSTASVAKGINFTGNAGADFLALSSNLGMTIGKAADGRALVFTGGDGNDTLEAFGSGVMALKGNVEVSLDGDADRWNFGVDALQVTGDLKLSAGAGDDGTDDDRLQVNVRMLKVSGAVLVDVGEGDNFAEISATSGKIGKELTMMGGTGADHLEVGGNVFAVTKDLTLAGGAGDNELNLDSRTLSIGGALAITAGSGADNVDAGGPRLLTVLGTTTINVGDGTNELQVTPDKGTFGKAIMLTGGADDDSFEFGDLSATAKASLTVNLGAGTNSFDLGADTLTITGDLSVTGGADADELDLFSEALTAKGAVLIDLKDGSNVIDSFLPRATFAKTVSLLGGAADDDFRWNGNHVTTKGAMLVDAGAGANTINFGGAVATWSDSLTIKGGADVDTLDVYSGLLTVTKALSIELGDGGNNVNISGGQMTFGSTVAVKGGAGDDVTFFGSPKLSAKGAVTLEGGAGQDQIDVNSAVLVLKAGLSITGGDDADTVNIFADGSILGDLTIDAGASADGNQGISISSSSGLPGILKVSGALTLKSQATDGGNAYTDAVRVTDLFVTKAVSISTGDADSFINVDNVSTASDFTLLSGGGADDVQIDTGNAFGGMTIGKLTKIDLGDGGDTLHIGGSAAAGSNNVVKFLGNLTVDGGLGMNFSNDFLNDVTPQNLFGPGVLTSRIGFAGFI